MLKFLAFFMVFWSLSANAVFQRSSDPGLSMHVPCNHHRTQRTAFFGDTHVHTKYSLDASTQGTRTSPAQAYKFARGESIGIQPWGEDGKALRSLQLQRPLDFAMVTDHAELMGEVSLCNTPGVEGFDTWQCKIYRNFPRVGYFFFNATAMAMQKRLGFCGEDGALCVEAALGPWQEMQQAAADAYDESENCEFTSFVAYEYTGVSRRAENMHRNVIFRNDQVPRLPFSSIENNSSYQLWDKLDAQCVDADSGCDVIVIPHNSNLSNGTMFTHIRDDGEPIDADDARQIARLETLVEVMQHKGSSECYFGLDANSGIAEDELCAFEQLPYDSFGGQNIRMFSKPARPEGGFLREVLRDGLRYQEKLGVNPFKWGFIGSTDTHLGTPGAVSESKFIGHGGAGVPAGEKVPAGLPDALEFNPGGLAVLWAEQNTRNSLFAAMRRREAYGTSGPRITVRFFGGWDYPANMCEQPDFAMKGYTGGVPMGGDLSRRQLSSQPSFAVHAVKDPGTTSSVGADLQRVQIIKGWVDASGTSQEKIYEVAGNPANGASVDINSCQTRGKGFESLCTVWKDPDFDADRNAWYYARVVENPTCRWSQYICSANQVDCDDSSTIKQGLEGCCAEEHIPTQQERAWTSPIWYTP